MCEVLDGSHEPQYLRRMADILDDAFGVPANWMYDGHVDGECYFLGGATEGEDQIVICPHQVDALMSRAGVASSHRQFCMFYVMAHERAHAFQERRARNAGRSFDDEYAADSVRSELEADNIAGFLYGEAHAIALAKSILSDPDLKSALEEVPPSNDGNMLAFIESLGGTTHGRGEWRFSEFIWGKSKPALYRLLGYSPDEYIQHLLDESGRRLR